MTNICLLWCLKIIYTVIMYTMMFTTNPYHFRDFSRVQSASTSSALIDPIIEKSAAARKHRILANSGLLGKSGPLPFRPTGRRHSIAFSLSLSLSLCLSLFPLFYSPLAQPLMTIIKSHEDGKGGKRGRRKSALHRRRRHGVVRTGTTVTQSCSKMPH